MHPASVLTVHQRSLLLLKNQKENVTGGRKGDKDILLVDSSNNVIVAYENSGKQYVSVSTNGGASFSSKQVNVASGVALATGGVLDTKGNAYIAWSGTNNTGNGPTTFDVQRSSNRCSTYFVTTVDEGQGEPQLSIWNIPYNSSSWPNGNQLSLAPAGVWHGFPLLGILPL